MYVLKASRVGAWWLVEAPVIHDCAEAPALAEAEEIGRRLLARALDVSVESCDVDVQILEPDEVAALLDEAAELEREARTAQSRASWRREVAAGLLRDVHGLNAADVDRVIGATRPRLDGSPASAPSTM